MMVRSALISVLCFGSLLTGAEISAQRRDSVSAFKKREWRETEVFCHLYANPATAYLRPDTAGYGRVETSYGYRSSEGLHLLSEGESSGVFGLTTEGLSSRSGKLFWGKVGYSSSVNRDVAWADITDAYRVGPYQVADSIGGDAYGETYMLEGGMAISVGKWVLGGEAGYRAGHSYRKTDPRPKSTTTDLYAEFSAGYTLWDSYLAGATVLVGKYEQDLGISVQRDNNKYDFYVMRGFGMYHMQESTYDSNFSWRYKGTNYASSLFFLPAGGSGFTGNALVRYESIDSYPGGNYIPFTFKTMALENDLGWKKRSDRGFRFAKLSYMYSLSKGTERVFQYQKVNEVFGQYFLLSSADLYTQKEMEVSAEIGKEWINGVFSKWILAKVGYHSFQQRYAYPVYRHTYNHLISTLRLGADFAAGKKWMVSPEIGGWYTPLLSSEELMIEKSELYDVAVKSDTEVYKASVAGVNAGVTCRLNLNKSLHLYTSLRGDYQFSESRNRTFGRLAIGVNY